MLRSDQTLWLLVSTALVMLTLPGVALFYGGMVRRKNVVNTVGLSLLALAVVPLEWLCVGDAMAFGRSPGSPAPQVAYHAMTAALALALVTGAVVERMRVRFFLVFGFLWVVAVYGPIARWLWGGGWLMNLGALDFAGGAVVHVSAGVTALVAAVLIGPRKGYGREEMKPNHLPFSFLGAGLMWVGWFGFAAGSALAPMTTTTGAFVAIQMSAVTAALAWMAVEWLQRDKPTVLGMVSGAVAGLVAITPAAGYVGPFSAVVIGIGAGGLCYMVVNYVKLILGYDDSLDVFGMHGVGGTWGMIATGLFASTAVNPDGSDGLFYGYPYQFFAQIMTVVSVWFFAGAVTFLLIKGLALVLRPRADHEAELAGLDLTEHGEKAYS
jgi:Amt family ammonium transporter